MAKEYKPAPAGLSNKQERGTKTAAWWKDNKSVSMGLDDPKLQGYIDSTPGLGDIVKGLRDSAAQRKRQQFKVVPGKDEDDD
jgi:hypothetical protein